MPNNDELHVTDGRVATIEMCRPDENYMDVALLTQLVQALKQLAEEGTCRAVVLCSQGKHFCAGVNFARNDEAIYSPSGTPIHLYDMALELYRQPLPIVAAVQGAAIGGGLGLALAADFRVATPQARFSANFARLGFHQGFGLTQTLPALVGQQRALRLLYTGDRIHGETALDWGMCDALVSAGDLLDAAQAFAGEIAASAPLAIRSIRTTMRAELVASVEAAMFHERTEQDRLRETNDWIEGLAAMNERRPANFTGN
jgi:2-(1,2-epoxy-1,2-dihydrophenyl)acetyl-CoA isomerase